ncbi:MAG: TM1812 family CRISPR-associated protein [Clostridiales Family XIII bacterium]|jgi:hypothetical protein|nr:TM1812 family CRISPR-associated protein [Clostridiales Family XIII bacterium]
MILFLSQYGNQPECEYQTDAGFTVSGAQTNEAPTKYAIRKLNARGEKLDKIIAFVTPFAKSTALERYTASVDGECAELEIPKIEIIPADIPNAVTITELLQKTIDLVLPVSGGDSVIIETTGGYRNAISALTLLSRFLRYGGVNIEFSTFSDFQTKEVSDTREFDALFDLLDAVNAFATTGNAQEIKKLLNVQALPGGTEFFAATREFYGTVLLCKSSNIESCIEKLLAAIDKIKNDDYATSDPRSIIFKNIIFGIIERKMTFINAENRLLEFVQWCCDNKYLQQSVTFLKESAVTSCTKKYIPYPDFQTLRVLRNSINHATGTAVYKPEEEHELERIGAIKKVNAFLDNPELIFKFVNKLLARLRDKLLVRSRKKLESG